MKELIVNENYGIRIDKYLLNELDLSRSQIKKLLEDGKILVNGVIVKASYLVKCNDTIRYDVSDKLNSQIIPEDIKLDIVYEDEYLAIINKESGMVVHPGCGNVSGTLANALLYRYGDKLSHLNGDDRPGIVHRLDADTSGLIIVCKDDSVHEDISRQLENRLVCRKYIALVEGVINEDSATIDAPIGRDSINRKKMCVCSDNSKDAVTHIKVIKRYDNATLIECELVSGRTHQIRVHMAYIGHPVINDMIYGHQKKYEKILRSNCSSDKFKEYMDFGQLLHAYHVEFTHPITHKKMEFSVDTPDLFKEIMEIYINNK